MKFKETFINIYKDLFKIESIYYFAFSIPILLFKFLSVKYSIAILFFLFVINELLNRIHSVKYKFNHEIISIRWISLISLILSVHFSKVIIGYLIIINIIVDRVSGIFRKYIKTNQIFKLTNKEHSGLLFFMFFSFIFGLLYFYFIKGYLLKTDGIIIMLTSIFAAFIESLNPLKFNDNVSLSLFSGIFMLIARFIDLHLHISGLNFVFGFLVCAIFVLILILLDVIKFKNWHWAYIISIFIYTGLGYFLFIFNILILIGFAVVYRLDKSNSSKIFLDLHNIKEYFYISVILSILSVLMKSYTFLRPGIAVGLLTGLTFYSIDYLDKLYGRKFFSLFNFKKVKRKNKYDISQEGMLINIGISIVYLFIGYLLHIFDIKLLLLSFVVVNLSWYLSKYIVSKFLVLDLKKESVKFLITYIPFMIIILINIG